MCRFRVWVLANNRFIVRPLIRQNGKVLCLDRPDLPEIQPHPAYKAWAWYPYAGSSTFS